MSASCVVFFFQKAAFSWCVRKLELSVASQHACVVEVGRGEEVARVRMRSLVVRASLPSTPWAKLLPPSLLVKAKIEVDLVDLGCLTTATLLSAEPLLFLRGVNRLLPLVAAKSASKCHGCFGCFGCFGFQV